MRARGAAALAALFALAGCDSGQVKEPSLPPPHLISGPLPVPSACAGRAQSPDHPGEPSLAVDPSNPRQLVATWQENRSPDDVGNVVAVSHDGGSTWNRAVLPSVLTCTGGAYTHATDPWVSIGQDGIVYVCALVTRSGSSAGTTRDIVVSISRDHGATWEAPAVLQSLTAPPALPDKDAILADPRRPGVAYAIWVEYPVAENAPSSVDQVVFARTTDGGHTWSKPVSIYNGNDEAQEHQLLMTAGGVLLDVFVEGSSLPGTPHPPPLPVKIRVMRSTNQGQTWSPPIDAASFTYTNATDPGTGGQLRFFGQQITAAAAGGPREATGIPADAGGGRRCDRRSALVRCSPFHPWQRAARHRRLVQYLAQSRRPLDGAPRGRPIRPAFRAQRKSRAVHWRLHGTGGAP
ncbi:MAG: exo-alpha-sialidase [Chloroflexi bacterium]|nr:MAG: exo-alpha-sialidase [Chloroflexota bacterium]